MTTICQYHVVFSSMANVTTVLWPTLLRSASYQAAAGRRYEAYLQNKLNISENTRKA